MSRARGTIAFGASIAIHALVLGLRFHGPTVERVAGSVPRLLAIETVPATRVLDIIPVTRRSGDGARIRPGAGRAGDRGSGLHALSVGPAAPAAVEALSVPPARAGAPDPRLWLPPASAAPAAAAPDPLARARDAVATRLEPFNDSLSVAAETERRAKEWTTKDGAGRLWGITPESIHLGKLAIPLRHCIPEPCPEDITYKGPPGLRDEYNQRLRGFRAIEEQAARVTTGKAIDERVRAIRERNAKRDTTGGRPLP